ncbi:MAG: hypothetical protein PHH40_00600 [Candidatus Moranbacteria bacterium]|nr:hypothetical protein [Candidatus Moranbacteria bacterium]MDD3964812.1 hypothetical protein [Candidatus Moranbacteria bacterium]
MELREYLDIFKRQIKWFWITILLFLFIAGAWQQNQPETLEATLLLNIGRASVQDTRDYTFDSFYRLQADERFADTVVRWLGSSRVAEDIYRAVDRETRDMSTQTLENVFEAKRLSSQMIEVTYAHPDYETLQKMSEATVTHLNNYAEQLNKESREQTHWFTIVGSDPIIRDVRITLSFALSVGLAFGIFIGFWVALIKHYFSK